MSYLILNETESQECFYILGCFTNLDDAVNAVNNIDPSIVDYIDDVLTVNVLKINGMTTYENATTVYSVTWLCEYNDDLDEYQWIVQNEQITR